MKDRKTYKILTWCSFFFPINRFYIGKTEGVILRSISCNLMMFGWLGDLLYMDKTFDEAMAKRGYVNTNIRNEFDKKVAYWVGDFYQHCVTSVFGSDFCCLVGQC